MVKVFCSARNYWSEQGWSKGNAANTVICVPGLLKLCYYGETTQLLPSSRCPGRDGHLLKSFEDVVMLAYYHHKNQVSSITNTSVRNTLTWIKENKAIYNAQKPVER